MVQNTGAVISIALVMAIVTAGIAKATLLEIFGGLASQLNATAIDGFIANMHTALWVLTAVTLLGALICLLRPSTTRGRELALGADGTQASGRRR